MTATEAPPSEPSKAAQDAAGVAHGAAVAATAPETSSILASDLEKLRERDAKLKELSEKVTEADLKLIQHAAK